MAQSASKNVDDLDNILKEFEKDLEALLVAQSVEAREECKETPVGQLMKYIGHYCPRLGAALGPSSMELLCQAGQSEINDEYVMLPECIHAVIQKILIWIKKMRVLGQTKVSQATHMQGFELCLGALISVVWALKNVHYSRQWHEKIQTLGPELSQWKEKKLSALNSLREECLEAVDNFTSAIVQSNEESDLALADDQWRFRSEQMTLMNAIRRYRDGISDAENTLRQIDCRAKDLEQKAKSTRGDGRIATVMGVVSTALSTGSIIAAGVATPVLAAQVALNVVAAANGAIGWGISENALRNVRQVLKEIDEQYEEIEKHWNAYNEIVRMLDELKGDVHVAVEDARRRRLRRKELDDDTAKIEKRARELDETKKNIEEEKRRMEREKQEIQDEKRKMEQEMRKMEEEMRKMKEAYARRAS